MALIAGPFATRVAEVLMSTAAVATIGAATFVRLERVNDPKYSGKLDTADSSSNDSGGNKEKKPTWNDATLTFSIVVDEGATQQELLWTAHINQEIRAFRFRPIGNNVGNRQYSILGIVTAIELDAKSTDVGRYNVTVERTGGLTRDTQ